jgi:predicted ribosomally synthesized peptide with nif11-like leader
MSVDSAKRFLEVLKKDQALQKRLGTAGDAEEVTRLAVALGAERGFSFTVEELPATIENGSELSDEDLESVAGGGDGPTLTEYIILIKAIIAIKAASDRKKC